MTRIKDISATAPDPASDDYLATDGLTNNTRKIPATVLNARGYELTRNGTGAEALAAQVAAAAADNVELYHFGALTLSEPLHLNKQGLRGAGGAHDAAGITGQILIGRASTETDPAPDRKSNYAPIRDISVKSNSSSTPTVQNVEAHWNMLDNVSMRGTKDAGVPHLFLGATLYNRISNCDFGGDGDGIHAKESSYDITYYGLNASWIDRCNFNQNGTAAWLHGIFSLRDSTIENSSSVAPKLIIGDDGQSTSAKCVIDHIYFETKTDTEVETVQPVIEIQSTSDITIRDCAIGANNGSHPDVANFAAIQSTTYLTNFSARNNSFSLSTNSDMAFDTATPADGYHEYVGNGWSTSRAYKIVVDGNNMQTRGSIESTNPKKRIYIRDRQHGEVRQNIPERNIWSTYSAAQNEIKVEAGKHHVITATPSGDLTVSDRTNWKGARFTIHFAAAGCVLKHGASYFYLAKAADAAVPQNTVLDFVVDKDGAVREVGAATVGFDAPA